jgi:hypothetical protein
MFGKDLQSQSLGALARQESFEVATYQAAVRRDYRDQQTDGFLTSTAKGLSYELLMDTEQKAAGNPFIAHALLEFDMDFMSRRRFALNMRALRD